MKRTIELALTLGALLAATASGLAQTMNSTDAAQETNRIERATLGGGCFWCLEAVFERLEGVKSVVSGYAGGTTANPTYKEVCSGETGHAEVVQIEYDRRKISFEKLLELFWATHDPTTFNRQGADVGTQYRSVIFHHSEAQKQAAEKSRAAAQKQFPRPIVTEIQPLTKFYPAEGYHQDYYRNNQSAPYCQMVIRPKLQKLEKAGQALPQKKSTQE